MTVAIFLARLDRRGAGARRSRRWPLARARRNLACDLSGFAGRPADRRGRHQRGRLRPTSYSIEAHAKTDRDSPDLSRNARGASTGQGAIVDGRVVAGHFRHHRRQRDDDPDDPDGARRQCGDRRRHLAAVRGQARPRAARTEHDKQGVVDPVGAFIIPAPATGPLGRTGRLQPQDSDLRRLHAFRRRPRLCRRARRIGQGLRGAGGDLRGALRADLRPPPRPARRPSSWPTTRSSKCGWRRSSAPTC